MNTQLSQSRQSGLSLVEIMVALVISSLLIAGVIQIFIGNKATFRLQEGLGRMQENARFALDFMTQDIRQAGYLGCTRNLANMQSSLLSPPGSFDPSTGLQGCEFTGDGGTAPGVTYDLNAVDAAPIETDGNNDGWAGWQTSTGEPALDSTPNVLNGSDVLRVWHAAPALAQVTGITPGTPTIISIDTNKGIGAGDFIVLSDCVAADLMQVCSTSSAGDTLTIGSKESNCGVGNNLGSPTASLATNAVVTPLVASTYFIGKKSGSTQNPPSLYFASLNKDGKTATPQELVQGVENMQILYGEDTDSDGQANIFRTANQVADWRNVTTIKIGLLMSTVKEVDTQAHGGDNDNYDVNGTIIKVIPEDRRPRKIFTTTIHLRNRST